MNKKVLKFGDEESIFIRDISQFDNITTYGNPHDCDCEFCDYEGVWCPECNSDFTKVIWDNRFEVMECCI